MSKVLLLGAGAGAIALLASKPSHSRRPRRRIVTVPPRHREPRGERRSDGEREAIDAAPSGMVSDFGDPQIAGIDEVVEYHVEILDEGKIDPVTGAGLLVDPDLGVDVAPRSELDEIESLVHDTGNLYGVQTQRATDRDLPDDNVSFDRGENWIEALEATSIENGPEPEVELEAIDDEDVGAPHPSDHRDIPVADRGAGGPGGA